MTAILEPHENHERRSGLAVNGLYRRDKASVQKAPLRSAKCVDTAGRPGDPLYDGRTPAPTVDRHTTTAFAGRHVLRVVMLSLRSIN
jgi:hypothetical protein